jgi:hypothetical protein
MFKVTKKAYYGGRILNVGDTLAEYKGEKLPKWLEDPKGKFKPEAPEKLETDKNILKEKAGEDKEPEENEPKAPAKAPAKK